MKTARLTLILAGWILTLPLFSQDTLIDGIIGIVGGNVILKSDIENQYLQMRAEGSISGSSSRVKCMILDNLLFQKLLVHQAGVDSLTVTESQVESEMDRRLRYFISQAGSPDELEKMYGKSIVQIKEDLRDIIREQLLAQLEQGKITETITITPAEVKSFYKKIPRDSLPEIPSKVEIGIIAKTPVIGQAERQVVIDRLKGFRERVAKGDDFATLAVLYSEDPGSASQGGNLGMFQRGTMRPEFEAAAFKLKPGEVSDVVQTEDGYHLIQMIERRGEYINVRHILLQPKVNLADMNSAKLFLDSVSGLIASKEISFGKAVAQYSDDPSKNNGGMLINMQSGNAEFAMNEVDPKVFFVIDKLKEGEVSTAVKWEERGKLQFRIYYLKTRTQPHKADLGQDYSYIHELALGQKKMAAIIEWVSEKAASTYIYISEPFTNCEFDRPWIPKKEE